MGRLLPRRPIEARAGLTIGRERSCDLVLDDPSVSRLHATLGLEGGRLRILDQDSRNGIRVNGRKRKHRTLRDGDLIRMGRTLVLFLRRPPTGSRRPRRSPHAW